MIPRHKIQDILERLLEKSRAGEVRWRKPDQSRLTDLEYAVVLPNYQIVLSRQYSNVLDWIVIAILDSSGALVGESKYEEGEDGWELASALMDEADTKVRGLDSVLRELEQAINAQGPIGLSGTAIATVVMSANLETPTRIDRPAR